MAILGGNSDSRYVGVVDVPETTKVVARFRYNFFVQDERTNASGAPQFHGTVTRSTGPKKQPWVSFKHGKKSVSQRTLDVSLPRQVEIEFNTVECGNGQIRDFGDQVLLTHPLIKGSTNSEVTLTTIRDAVYRSSDVDVRTRLEDHAKLLTNILNVGTEDPRTQVSTILAEDELIDGETLTELLSPESTPGIEYVNEVGDKTTPSAFTLASLLTLDVYLERRLLRGSLVGDFTKESVLKTENNKISKRDVDEYVRNCETDAGRDSFEPTFVHFHSERVGAPSDLVQTMTVGYIIDRKEVNSAGEFVGKKSFLVDGVFSTSYIDTQVVYGSVYTYSVRTVALVELVYDSDGTGSLREGHHRILMLVASRPSKSTLVKAIERIPPLEPDGVFFSYRYDGDGLMIRWQIPVGKQRDVKYFQIFRRKTIYEPFMCIAELDFDNSNIKSMRRERVNVDRTTKFKSPVTQYVDGDFSRDSKYIYAIVALDAHGLTSGYSAQSYVTFDKIRNVIELKNISKSGAPKQYPNFFIDPDLDDNIFVDSLTQDVMLSSHKKKMRVYFDPDAISCTGAGKGDAHGLDTEGLVLRGPLTQQVVRAKSQDGTIYKLHLLNTDRQKSTTLELTIDNLGSA